MMVGKWVSFWDCLFLEAMLNFSNSNFCGFFPRLGTLAGRAACEDLKRFYGRTKKKNNNQPAANPYRILARSHVTLLLSSQVITNIKLEGVVVVNVPIKFPLFGGIYWPIFSWFGFDRINVGKYISCIQKSYGEKVYTLQGYRSGPRGPFHSFDP